MKGTQGLLNMVVVGLVICFNKHFSVFSTNIHTVIHTVIKPQEEKGPFSSTISYAYQ